MASPQTWRSAFGQYVNLVVTASESSINVANNTSVVSVKAELHYHTGTTSTHNAYPQTLTVKIDGTTVATLKGVTYSLSASSRTKVLGTWSRTITHGSDGSKTVNINVVHDDFAGWKATVNQSYKLDTIPRATTPKLSASTVALGSSITINLPRASGSFTHKITYDFAGLNGQTSGIGNATSAGTSTTFTPPASLASRIPTRTSNGCVIYVETFNGSTSLGKKSIGVTITVPNNSTYNPAVGTISVAEQHATIKSSLAGIWVQNHSRIRVSAPITLRYSATISSARVYIGGAWRSAKVSGSTVTISADYIPTGSGSHSITVEATDSRGRVTSKATSITVSAYSPPRATVSANRGTNATQLQITAKATGTNLGNKNTLTMQLFIRTNGATSWGTKVTLPTGKAETSTSGTLDWGTLTYSGYSETNSYEVMVQFKDVLSGWSQPTFRIGTASVLMDAYLDRGVSFGKFYEPGKGGPLQVGSGTSVFDGGLHVVGPLYMDGGIQSKMIPSNADLNSYQTAGFYYNPANAQVATMKNVPITSAFSLLVEKHAGSKQTLTAYLADQPITFIRNFYNGSWGAWYQIYEASSKSRNDYSSLLNGFSGFFRFYKKADIVFFEGYFQGSGTSAITTSHDLFYPHAKYAPTAHLRMACTAWGPSLGTNQTTDTEGYAILRIEKGKFAVEKLKNRAVRYYCYGSYLSENTER